MISSDVALRATGLLRAFNEAGVLGLADVHPALHITHLFGEKDEAVQLGFALAVRALRAGSMCVDLSTIATEAIQDADEQPALSWPDTEAWLARLQGSACVTIGHNPGPTNRPLRLIDNLLYLERHWRDEETVRNHLTRLAESAPRNEPIPEPSPELDSDQQHAVRTALLSNLSVVAGGPGTGKTRIIAEILAGANVLDAKVLIGLAAPTGKAAARMTETLGASGMVASTIHRMLGWRPGARNRFKHDRTNPLPHDLVIIDETSMVSTTLMARLVEALKPTARLVLVGDPNQLSSVEVGAVLADLVSAASLASNVATLHRNYRFAGSIASLADAIRNGDSDAALDVLTSSDSPARLFDEAEGMAIVRTQSVLAGTSLWQAARESDRERALKALGANRLLCAHRTGRWGVGHWSRIVHSWLTEAIPGYATDGEFYVGRPLMMTRNAPEFDLYNGDTGVALPPENGMAVAVFGTGGGPRDYSPWLIDGLESVDAMTIHKSQGSQFDQVSVVLPPLGSPLLTRELLYTAVTRAVESVTILGDKEAVIEAVNNPTHRTSGLARRL